MIQAEDKQMEPEEILRMDWLAENVEGHIPVSYTHLDVYKRQSSSRAG